MIYRWVGVATCFVWLLLGWRVLYLQSGLDAERTAHVATAKERDQWRAAAEMYQKDAEAQAENARLCLDRETKTARNVEERAAIVKRARPRPRSAEEKDTVVDDETRRRAIERLNRPL